MPIIRRFVLLSIVAAFILVLSAAITVPVYADGEMPPVESPQQVDAEGEAEADTSLDETSSIEESEGDAADQAGPEPESVADEITQPETTESIITELPADTELIVVDEDGEPIPLASQEAAEAVNFIDPVWCPVGVTPKDGTGGCTPAYGSLYDLIFDIANNVITEPGKAGVIWIQAGADASANPIIINGSDPDLGSWRDFALTLQGGWNGTYGSTAIVGVSTFSQPISIIDWNASVTINNITIAGATGDGLNVATTGNIVLKNVQSNNNTGRGASLDNTGGTGNITVTNGQFNNNAGTQGLLVASNGMITLKDVTANSNSNGYGAVLTNDSAVTPKAVILSGTNTFSNNNIDGLHISTKGAVTLNNVTASENVNGYGAQIINNDDPAVPSAVTLTGTNIFNDNDGGYGLYIATYGRVTISNLYANSNTGNGARVVNSGGNTPQPVTLTGTNEFKYNTIFGLSITSYGAITLNNIAANSNGQIGVSLGVLGTAVSNITLKGTNTFNDNGYTGLNVQGNNNGAIAISNITATGNGTSGFTGGGAAISFVTNVTITGLNNTFDSNYHSGLYVFAKGVITLSNIKASFNGVGGGVGSGATLDNTASGPSVPKGVTLLGTNVFNSNDLDGLLISSYGAVTVNNVSASDNGQGGSFGSGAYITNNGSTNPQKVALNGVNTFNDNMEYGLLVISKGAILVNSITANSNDFYGVFLQNNAGPVTSTVTLNGTNVFSGNVNDNLFVQAAGLITLNNIKANSSTTGNGAYVSNAGSFTAGVNIFGVNEFNFNNLHGLHVQSNGAIRANSITANSNGAGGGHGAWLNNANSGIKAGVAVTGTNTFNNNLNGEGLFIWSLGTVSTNNLTAVSNGGRGVSIDNGSVFILFDPIGSVVMTGANVFSGNGSHNLYIDSFGLVSLANINSTGSVNGAGVSIDNTGGPAPKPVTLSGLNNIFSDNSSDAGLVIFSDGAITLNNVTASNNGSNGAYLSNSSAATPLGVTLLGANTFNNNGSMSGAGLYIESRGTITTTNLTASGNLFSQGANLMNAFAGSTAGVVLKGFGVFDGNVSGGLTISTNGVITIFNLTATSSTAGYGASLNNTGTPLNTNTPKAISLLGTNNISNNATDGLLIATFGSVTINNLTASYNGQGGASGMGASIDNYHVSSIIPANVTLTGANSFVGNFQQGLYITAFGTIKANTLTASDSVTSRGAELSNQNAPSNAYGVTLSGANNFNGNAMDGLYISTKGAVLLNAVTATFNTNNGANIDNTHAGPAAPKPVTLTGKNNFSSNAGGLYILSNGVVTAGNVTASSNTNGYGASVDNASATAAVIFTGTNVFNDNNINGLYILSRGAVSLSNITASGNMFSGLDVSNILGTAGVTLTGVNNFHNNGDNGATINSNGNVSITKIFGDQNGQSGLVVVTTGTVTLTCGGFYLNTMYGWEINNAALAFIKGVFTAGNVVGDYNTALVPPQLSITRACPLP